ncbi:MAG: helix-turn-helix transcriptional regulator [Acidobacteriota bacterium]
MSETLGLFEQQLLFSLLALGEEAHGIAIRELVEEKTGRRRSPGSVHTTLDRLEKRGLIGSWLGEPTPVRGGRRKRFYLLTALGARSLKSCFEQLERMADGQMERLNTLVQQGGGE